MDRVDDRKGAGVSFGLQPLWIVVGRRKLLASRPLYRHTRMLQLMDQKICNTQYYDIVFTNVVYTFVCTDIFFIIYKFFLVFCF